MCGGAIISDFIAPTGPRRLTADYLWPDLRKSKKGSSKRYSKPVFDNFEADFQEFKDKESDVEDFDGDADGVLADVKPFAFSAKKKPSSAVSRGNNKNFTKFSSLFVVYFLFFLLTLL